MDKKEKAAKKATISKFIDTSHSRLKDYEVDRLYDMVTNRDKYRGMSKTRSRTYDSFCSDGKFTRHEETTVSYHDDGNRVELRENYSYKDDDGQTGSHDRHFRTAREILDNFGRML